MVQKEREWAAAHPDAIYIRMDEINFAIAEGRFSDARRLIPQLDAIMRHEGLTKPADDFIRDEANNLIESGDTTEGTRLFRSVPVDNKDEVSVLGLARVGDFAAATSALRANQAEFPSATIWNDYRGPEVQAIIALATHKPREALSALERARPLEGRDPIMIMLRGDAYLAAGEPSLAEASYRKVILGPDQQPELEEIPLSWLGLGRALSAEGKRSAAVEAYTHFLSLWAHADPNSTCLRQARDELRMLSGV